MEKLELELYGETITLETLPNSKVALEIGSEDTLEFGPDFAFLFNSIDDFKRFAKLVLRFDESISG